MKVVGYLFEEKDRENGQGIEWQRQQIAEFASGQGVRIVRFYHEQSVPAAEPFGERSVGKNLLRELDTDDMVVVCKVLWVLSSASESLKLIQEMARRRVSLYCLDLNENITLPCSRQLKIYEGAAGVIGKILEALQENERSSHGQSIRLAKQKMKHEGKYLGGPVPFGWRIDGARLIVDEEQQKIIKEIEKLKADRRSYRDIAHILREQYDIHFSHEGVRKIFLKNSEGKGRLTAL